MQRVVYAITAALLCTGAAEADQTLAMQSGCLGCHKADAKLVGPSFQQIAAKYRSDDSAVERLAAKVKSGSNPDEPLVWGEVPMPPSPADPQAIRTVILWMLEH